MQNRPTASSETDVTRDASDPSLHNPAQIFADDPPRSDLKVSASSLLVPIGSANMSIPARPNTTKLFPFIPSIRFKIKHLFAVVFENFPILYGLYQFFHYLRRVAFPLPTKYDLPLSILHMDQHPLQSHMSFQKP